MTDPTSHPCPFPDSTVEMIAAFLPPDRYPTVLDPFAGIGKIHALPQTTYGIEIEEEWANQIPDNAVKPYATFIMDATDLSNFPDNHFSAVATSPCFGNRMADHHDAKDNSTRNTYKHKLGRDPSPNSASILHWGPEYRNLHRRAWLELSRVVAPGGRFVLNIKNHIRKGVEQPVSEWHMTTLIRMGWKLVAIEVITTPGLGYGANRELRTDHEYLFVFDAIWTKVGLGGFRVSNPS